MPGKTVIDELVTLLGVEVPPKAKQALTLFGTSVDSIKKRVQTASTVLMAGASAIVAYTTAANAASADLKRLSDASGINSDTLQEMGFAAEMAGGSFQGMLSDLQHLQKSMNSPIPGEFNEGLFLLGINTKKANGALKTTDEVLMDVSKKMQGMTAIEQAKWAEKIGVGQDTLLLLKQGPAAIAAYRKQAQDIPTIISKEDLANAQQFGIQLKMVHRILAYIGQTAASVAGPALKGIVSDFGKWLKDNKEIIKLGLKNLIVGIADGFRRFWDAVLRVKDMVTSFLPGLKSLAGGLLDVQNISSLLFGALVVIAGTVAVMAGQWLLMAAGVAAVVAVLEDFMVYLQGGDSLIGKLLEKFPGFAKALNLLVGIFKLLGSVIGIVFVEALKGAWEILKMIFKGWDMIFSAIASLGEKLGLTGVDVDYSGMTAPTAQGAAQPAPAGKTEVNVTQHIQSTDPVGAASESKRGIGDALQTLSPGLTAPVAG